MSATRGPYRVEHDPARLYDKPVPVYVNGVWQPDMTGTVDSWHVVDAGGRCVASFPYTDEGRAGAELHAAERTVGDDIVPVRLADGRVLALRRTVADDVRGVDENGYVVVADGDTLYPLTPCCNASGKGSSDSETGVVCRACYADVDECFGGFATVAVAVAP